MMAPLRMQPSEIDATARLVARRLTLRGLVQGIGMRPAIARLAYRIGLAGEVANTRNGLEIFIEGSDFQIQNFLEELRTSVPEKARIEACDVVDDTPKNLDLFSILQYSDKLPLQTIVPVDLATCSECQAEFSSNDNPRSGYSLMSCTECGPRYSIIEQMPFERTSTTMNDFPLCESCQSEYESLEDRRAHAQTMSCPKCGPNIWFESSSGICSESRIALQIAARVISEGKILAVRGLGGYQLIVDATQQGAVTRLRERKRRLHKPFAIMVPDTHSACCLGTFDEAAIHWLQSPQNPIVIVKLLESKTLAPAVGLNDTIGLMLPTTPIHCELCRLTQKPLVVTSGNVEGVPLEAQVDSAVSNLSLVADGFLHHDRPIFHPIDDSVIRPMKHGVITIRNARGLAPLPLSFHTNHAILATGGQQKCAIALSNGSQAVLGHHVGDLGTLETCRHFEQQTASLLALYDCQPQVIVHDMHPDYYSTRWAQRQSIPTLAVQHHHAHVASVMLEHDLLDRELLGIACDGTGYGTDGSIWGGEILLATVTEFKRVGSLRPFQLPGGEKAINQPWRTAFAVISNACGSEVASQFVTQRFAVQSLSGLRTLLSRSEFAPTTTSLGRLLDAAAAIITGQSISDYEAQLPQLLETLASGYQSTEEYSFPLVEIDGMLRICWQSAIRELVLDAQQGLDPQVLAGRFLYGLASGLVSMCERFPDRPIVLSGGCFQNRLLLDNVVDRLRKFSRTVYCSERIPINDGGLAAGQLAVASAILNKNPTFLEDQQACA